jgi:uncharacterized protein YbaR (Trm112 family)
MAVSQELLEILRCPHCVSGPTRRPGNDPGRLELVQGVWLVCQEPGCGRKYPIKEDIPVMLIDEGDKWINTGIEELPEPGLLVDPAEFGLMSPLKGGIDSYSPSRNQMLATLLALLAVILVAAFIFSLLRRPGQED